MHILRYAENLPPTASLAYFGIKTGSRIISFMEHNFYFLLFTIFFIRPESLPPAVPCRRITFTFFYRSILISRSVL